MNPRINLFYLSPNPYGGWVTFTAHLMAALRKAGMYPNLYKIGNNTERKPRTFGYGEKYRNLKLRDALTFPGTNLVVAAAKKFKGQTTALLEDGASIVVHDPTELKNLPDGLVESKQVVVIRRTGLDFIPDATFIRHPYQRMRVLDEEIFKTKLAVSTSRIDFDKNTDILLDANRILKQDGEELIDIRGFENRLYTKFKIMPKYPEWEQSKAAYPRDRDGAFMLLRSAHFMTDMSIIKGDGGGTQYTTLEAWDAGAVPVIHEDWINGDDDDMRDLYNCFVVGNAGELARTLVDTSGSDLEAMRQNFDVCLERHGLHLIGSAYRNFLGV